MIDLPPDYQPFKTMVICTNEFVDGRIPIEVEERPVFIVGKNDPSKTWLYAPFERDGKREWQAVVVANTAVHRSAQVIRAGNSTGIIWNDEQVLHVVAMPDEDKVEIPALDFRPLGLAIHGDIGGLRVGGSTYMGNFMRNVRTMVKIG